MMQGLLYLRRILLFLLFFSSFNIRAADKPPSIGNFSLPSSQQPGPFFSFGQNIVDKHQLIVSYNPSYTYSQALLLSFTVSAIQRLFCSLFLLL